MEGLKSPQPKNKRHKVYMTEDQIIAAIDRLNKRLEKLLTQEHCLKNKAQGLFGELEKECMAVMLTGKNEQWIGKLERKAIAALEESQKCAKAYNRIKEKTIPRLGRALAAMRTMTMVPVMGEYRGAVSE